MLCPKTKTNLEKTRVKFKRTGMKKRENRHKSHKGIRSTVFFVEITELRMFYKQ